MKVLIGVDGSDHSFAAVRQAGRLLAAGKDEVAFYYSPPEIRVKAKGSSPTAAAKHARDLLSSSVFEQSRKHLPEPLRASVHEIVGTQHPRHGLMVAAEEWRADLIVVGARGVGTMQKLLLGSVSDSVVQTSHVPVLVVRGNAVAADGERVLLGVDGSAASREAGAFLKNFTWTPGSAGRLVYVMESMFAGELPTWLAEKARDAEVEKMAQAWIAEHDAERAQRRQELIAFSSELPELFHHQEPIVAEGTPAEHVLKAADETKANLIVLGARGLGVWKRLLVGSTSHKVLLHAQASVLIVRQREQP
ncbi:MAG: universal stress protein [Pirellulales bacterium]|nr:universal stress protein [Pirellulales bacterium]